MVRAFHCVGVLVVLLASVTCGGGNNSPSSPSPSALASPTGFRIALQRVHWTSNEVQLSWSGSGPSYRLHGASTPGGSDLLTVETTGTSYTWTAPRTAGTLYIRVVAFRGSETSTASPELPVYTLDLRNVVDALFFRGGPMADNPDIALTNPQAGLWADGTNVSVLVSPEAGEASRSRAQTFTDDYSTLSQGRVSASVQMTNDDFRSVPNLAALPIFTIAVRAITGGCPGGAGVLACANLGPEPIGINRSFVTLNNPGGVTAISHEMGHAYGMGHVHVTAAVRSELNFLMNPTLLSQQMTEPERTAINAAWDAGLRGGWRRSEALAAGLVLSYPPSAAVAGSALPPPSRDDIKCRIVDGGR